MNHRLYSKIVNPDLKQPAAMLNRASANIQKQLTYSEPINITEQSLIFASPNLMFRESTHQPHDLQTMTQSTTLALKCLT